MIWINNLKILVKKILQKIISGKLVHADGFSNGWAAFIPKNPPPLVPSILIDSKAATGPTAMVCRTDSPVSVVPKAPGSRVETT